MTRDNISGAWRAFKIWRWTQLAPLKRIIGARCVTESKPGGCTSVWFRTSVQSVTEQVESRSNPRDGSLGKLAGFFICALDPRSVIIRVPNGTKVRELERGKSPSLWRQSTGDQLSFKSPPPLRDRVTNSLSFRSSPELRFCVAQRRIAKLPLVEQSV